MNILMKRTNSSGHMVII